MKKMTKVAALLLAGTMVMSLAACSSKSDTTTTTAAAEETTETTAETEAGETVAEGEMGPIFKDLKENGVLKVGIIGNDPTFCFHTVQDGKDVLAGFEVAGMYEMADRLSEYLDREVTVEFYESDFTGCMSALEANQVFFVTRLSPTDERKETWLFTDVYHKSNECYVALKDNVDNEKFTGTLEGVSVCGQMGSIDITMTQHLYPDAEIQELGLVSDLLLSVKNGKSDLACMNAVSAAMSVAANPDLAVVDSLTWEPPMNLIKAAVFAWHTAMKTLQNGQASSSLISLKKAFGLRCSLMQQHSLTKKHLLTSS